jgi:hypothetical protein
MYEHLIGLQPSGMDLLGGLKPLSSAELVKIRQKWPSAPGEYLAFLAERGSGSLEDGSPLPPFFFGPELLNAERDYYGDALFRENGPFEAGAKGDVWIFGTDSTGTAFGFDSGDGWRILQIDNMRWVTRLDLSFKQFIEGLLICYPQLPRRYAENKWFDSSGASYEARLS